MVYIKIYIDLDGTVINTIKCIADLYNEDFRHYEKYKPVHWTEINTWEFEELNCASKEYLHTYFNQARFFDKVELMDWYTKEVIDKLSKYYEIIFVSLGDSANLKLKEEWIKHHFSYAAFTGVDSKEYCDKSHIDMSGDIFIDDMAQNLSTSNAKVKICFGDEYPWNESYKGLRIYNWYDVGRYFGIDLL